MEQGIFNLILIILGVLGTWVGVYLAYRSLKKDTKKIVNSFNKINVQKGKNISNLQ